MRKKGFSLVELLVVIAIIMVIAAIAIPNLQQSLGAAGETAAIRELETFYTAQTQYLSLHGRYAATLAELGPGKARLISRVLAESAHNGYRYSLLVASQSEFAVSAFPESAKRRAFYIDQTRVVRFQPPPPEPATAQSAELR